MKNLIRKNRIICTLALMALMPMSSFAASLKISKLEGSLVTEKGIEIVSVDLGLDIFISSFGFGSIPTKKEFSPQKAVATKLQVSSGSEQEYRFETFRRATHRRFIPIFSDFEVCRVSIAVTAQDSEGTELQAQTNVIGSDDPDFCSNRALMSRWIQDKFDKKVLYVSYEDEELVVSFR